MKKYLVVLVAMLLVVTGCGGKKLTCTLDETDQKSTVAMEFDKDNVVTNIKMTVSVPLEKELTAEEKEYMESYMGLMCASPQPHRPLSWHSCRGAAAVSPPKALSAAL